MHYQAQQPHALRGGSRRPMRRTVRLIALVGLAACGSSHGRSVARARTTSLAELQRCLENDGYDVSTTAVSEEQTVGSRISRRSNSTSAKEECRPPTPCYWRVATGGPVREKHRSPYSSRSQLQQRQHAKRRRISKAPKESAVQARTLKRRATSLGLRGPIMRPLHRRLQPARSFDPPTTRAPAVGTPCEHHQARSGHSSRHLQLVLR